MTDLLTLGPDDGPLLLLAHGAGAAMDSPFMTLMATLLAEHGLATARFEFAYMAARRTGGKRRPPPKAETLAPRYEAVVATAAARGDRLAESWLTEAWTPEGTPEGRPEAKAEERRRDVVFTDAAEPLSARILWRPALPAGFAFAGPAVIEEPNSTILIHPGDRVSVGPTGHLMVELAR